LIHIERKAGRGEMGGGFLKNLSRKRRRGAIFMGPDICWLKGGGGVAKNRREIERSK
jgi:hypothetical protein